MIPHCKQHHDISQMSGYKTPATARWYFDLCSEDDVPKLQDILQACQKTNTRYLILGGGTNMMFAFDEFDGVIIHNNLVGYELEDKQLSVYAGHSIWKLAEDLEYKHGIDIWHRFIGLPGSVGGAVFGNAGCFGLETENNFVSADFLHLETGDFLTLTKDQMDFSYRNSRVKKKRDLFCIKVRFDLSQKIEKYHSDVDNIDFRENKQPNGNSCGSFFKNPSREQSAGFLIEQVGLKWYSIGGAFFSEKHANFLMSDGTATWQELVELQSLAVQKVQDQFGITLENEVQIITN